MDVAIITAYDTRRAIGTQGDLPWGRDLPADLAHFQRITAGGSVIMGRATFESIGSRPLPRRENIVISSRPTGVAGVLTALDLESALALARFTPFVIGGAMVYTAALTHPRVTTIYATEVHAQFADSDTFFPQVNPAEWHETARIDHPADAKNRYPFSFVTYQRITPQLAH